MVRFLILDGNTRQVAVKSRRLTEEDRTRSGSQRANDPQDRYPHSRISHFLDHCIRERVRCYQRALLSITAARQRQEVRDTLARVSTQQKLSVVVRSDAARRRKSLSVEDR